MDNQAAYFTHQKIVIGVPAFNEDQYIGATLSSVMQQTWKDFIVIISDNASTDKTAYICQEFCSIDNRFRYIRQSTNIGASGNFHYLYNNSNSPYFMWLGAHDILEPEFLTIHLSILEKTNRYTLSYSCTQWINEEGKQINLSNGNHLDSIQGFPLIRYIKSLTIIDECTAINQLIRREALRGVTFEPVIAGDHILLSRILYVGEINKVNEPLYKRRDLKIRTTNEMERITGIREVKPDFDAFFEAYLRDFDKIESNFFVNKLARPIIYWILRDRFIGDCGRIRNRLIRILKSILN